jgi:hypothetical protein
MSVYVLDHVEGKRLRPSYDEWPTSPPSGKTLAKPKRAKKNSSLSVYKIRRISLSSYD